MGVCGCLGVSGSSRNTEPVLNYLWPGPSTQEVENQGSKGCCVQKYKNATLFFSQDSASIAAVIPAMDKLEEHLKPGTQEPYHPAIQAAMKLVQKKINRYYSMTDLSSVSRIAMGQ